MYLWACRLWFKGITTQWFYLIKHTPNQLRPKLLSLLLPFPIHPKQPPQTLFGISLRLAPISLLSLGAPGLRDKLISIFHRCTITMAFASLHEFSKS